MNAAKEKSLSPLSAHVRGRYRRGTANIGRGASFIAALLSFVLYGLSHAHEVPARQG